MSGRYVEASMYEDVVDQRDKLTEKVGQLEEENKELRELVEEIKPIITEARQLTHTQLAILPIKYWDKNLSGVAQNLGYLEDKLKEIGEK